MIPMIDIARLLAEKNVFVSLITTPNNASRFQSSIHRSNLPIQIVQIPFPCNQVGLPDGYENLDTLPSPDLLKKFYNALDLLQKPLEDFIRKAEPPPSCVISDKCISWTSDIAKKFRIPRIVFHGMCCFSLLSSRNVMYHNTHNSVDSDSEPFLVPDIPHKIEITKAQLPGSFVSLADLDDVRNKMREAESSAYGVVVNSFNELEQGCAELYEKAIGKKVWCIGPVSLCNKKDDDKFERGNRASIDERNCLEWLNSKKNGSVIYACLGSLCRLVPSQLIEIGLALEATKRPFIWVVKTGEKSVTELENWLTEARFEERVKNRGILIKGWAPQVFILSHPSVGGFLTHCGWNSTIEAVCSGLPMLTWPLFAEQFFNEKLIVEVLKIGIRVGVDRTVRWGEEESVGVVLKKDRIEIALEKLMDGGEDGQIRRNRARQLQLRAVDAMENHGSSHLNMSLLIEDVMKSLVKQD